MGSRAKVQRREALGRARHCAALPQVQVSELDLERQLELGGWLVPESPGEILPRLVLATYLEARQGPRVGREGVGGWGIYDISRAGPGERRGEGFWQPDHPALLDDGSFPRLRTWKHGAGH
ncbi:MAG: hypothetical protein IPN34_23035 [Planctomycetes bacterium]|nr:hypothetical protein [Planctomycetota bacterium]